MSFESARRSLRAPDFATNILLAVLLVAVLGLGLLISTGAARTAPSVEPRGLDSMRALALELLRAADYERSIVVYREIVRQTPNDARSHYDLAAALAFVQRYEEAAAPIQSAIRLAPDDVRMQEMASLIFLNLKWYAQAFEATLNAAELGESTAMYSLVNMYEKGLGVAADADKAVYWAIKAAEHGHLGAMRLLADAYRSGRLGRRIDDKEADRWAEMLREAKSAWK